MDNQRIINNQKELLKKIGKKIGFGTISVILLIIIAIASYKILVEYVWMDSVGYETVYTTILYSKVTLGVVGFLLFAILTF